MADWLFRLSAADWLSAAERELELGEADARSRRKVVTHLRRAAGMALNAVLIASVSAKRIERDEAPQVWGRSYIDHLRVVASSAAAPAPTVPPSAPQAVIDAAAGLLEIPVNPPQGLVRLGRGPAPDVTAAMSQARLMLEWARAYTEASDPDLATL